MSIDMSYRDTGVCFLTNEHGIITINKTFSYKNPSINYGFEGLRMMSIRMKAIVNAINFNTKADVYHAVLVEMPFFSQNAKSAMAVGVCWGAIQSLDCTLVEPSFLKLWSGSKKGDGKSEVKEKVKRLCSLDRKALANDNQVDAVGIGLAFCELININ